VQRAYGTFFICQCGTSQSTVRLQKETYKVNTNLKGAAVYVGNVLFYLFMGVAMVLGCSLFYYGWANQRVARARLAAMNKATAETWGLEHLESRVKELGGIIAVFEAFHKTEISMLRRELRDLKEGATRMSDTLVSLNETLEEIKNIAHAARVEATRTKDLKISFATPLRVYTGCLDKQLDKVTE